MYQLNISKGRRFMSLQLTGELKIHGLSTKSLVFKSFHCGYQVKAWKKPLVNIQKLRSLRSHS